jgi:PAS domain S-box-containing protein
VQDLDRQTGGAAIGGIISPALRQIFSASDKILDLLPIAVYICDANGAIVRYNRRAAELWGRVPQEGQRYSAAFRLFRPDGSPLPVSQGPMARALRTRLHLRDQEIIIERPDGARISALVNIDPLVDENGTLLGAVSCFQDITELRRVMDELRRSEQDLEEFFENGAVGLHLVSSDGTILRANRAELNMLGYAPEEYVGHHLSEFHVDRGVMEDILQRLAGGEKLDRYPARLRAKDSSIKHVLITSNIQFRKGTHINTRCFTLDVTETRRAADALIESQQRLAATYQHAAIGIAETDTEGRLIEVNETTCTITGYSREELLQRTIFDVMHPDDRELDRESYARQVSGVCDRYGLEMRLIRKDARTIWVQMMSSTVCDSAGRFLYGVRIVQDITERKLGEQRQKLLLDELNHRVKNTLATVQSLAAQTARSVASPNDFCDVFDGRLIALSRAHDQLTRRRWENADLREMLMEALAPYQGSLERIVLRGTTVELRPRAALTLAMIFHELVTNAVKHGALSAPTGRVEIEWGVQDGNGQQPTLHIAWRESGGPPVAPPKRRGFGSLLVERSISAEHGGHAALDFDPDGVRCTIDIPLEGSK